MIEGRQFAIWPSAGTGRKREKALEHAKALIASCNAVEQIVAALTAGRIPAPDVTGVRASELRFAPHFAARRGATERNTVPYSIRWIERTLIEGGKSSKWLRVAMDLLEGMELGYVTQATFDNIINLRPGYSAAQLSRSLKRTHKRWESMHASEIALGIEPQ